jgi:cytochrome c-type biogenesis protein CcmH
MKRPRATAPFRRAETEGAGEGLCDRTTQKSPSTLALGLALLLSLAAVALPARALDPDERLDDPVLEARAHQLGSELRCVVCQSENIEISNAPLAADMRRLVRERIKAGATDAEVKAYLVERYGDYVLMRPPVKPETYALWLAPALLLGAGGVAAYFVLHGQARLGPLDDPDPEEAAKES